MLFFSKNVDTFFFPFRFFAFSLFWNNHQTEFSFCTLGESLSIFLVDISPEKKTTPPLISSPFFFLVFFFYIELVICCFSKEERSELKTFDQTKN